MSNEFTPRKAEKARVKLKMAVQGPSGSGKTEGALALAKNFAAGGRILLVDTENESASLYANRYDFDTIALTAPYTSKRYQQAMQAAVDGGYDVLIVDSITPQWDGQGGILARKDAKDASGGNQWTNWGPFTAEHTAFVEFIKQLPIHTIVTMRSKQAYVLEKNDRGKETPRKVGMAPIQRDGSEYEYTLVFDVGMSHRALTSKNRTTLFQDNEPIDLTAPAVATSIREWLADGAEPRAIESPAPATPPVQSRPPARQTSAPPSSAAVWKYELGNLTCHPLDAERRKTKADVEFIAVKLNGKCEGKNMAFCWHSSLFDACLAAKERPAQFSVELSGEYLNITDVIAVAGKDYRDGVVWVEPTKPAQDPLEITDDDIPF